MQKHLKQNYVFCEMKLNWIESRAVFTCDLYDFMQQLGASIKTTSNFAGKDVTSA